MRLLLEIVVVVVVAPIALGGLTLALFFRKLKQPILIVPGAKASPPLAWRWSITPPALAHKRILRSIRSLQARVRQYAIDSGFATARGSVGDLPAVLTALIGEIEADAVRIDMKLIAIEREDRHLKRKFVDELDPDITRLEASAQEAESILLGFDAIGPPSAEIDLATRLKVLKEAVGELRDQS